MYESDAIAKGLLKKKVQPQAQNKMREAPENKSAASAPAGEDFTKIPGVGRATASELHARGILTFDQLAASDLDFLQQGKVRQAIEAYFAG
jgi:predicted flap endonuclease-1-like 5' DNA nuclease